MSDPHFFNLYDPSQGIRRQLADGLETRIFPGDNVMISVVRIGANKSGEVHSHPQEQWGVLLEGSGVRIQDGVEHPVSAGDFWQTPGGVTRPAPLLGEHTSEVLAEAGYSGDEISALLDSGAAIQGETKGNTT